MRTNSTVRAGKGAGTAKEYTLSSPGRDARQKRKSLSRSACGACYSGSAAAAEGYQGCPRRTTTQMKIASPRRRRKRQMKSAGLMHSADLLVLLDDGGPFDLRVW